MNNIKQKIGVFIFLILFAIPVFAQNININTADRQTIAQALKGIGPKKAQAIIDYRQRNGWFTQVDQLKEIKGIGDIIIQWNRSKIRFF